MRRTTTEKAPARDESTNPVTAQVPRAMPAQPIEPATLPRLLDEHFHQNTEVVAFTAERTPRGTIIKTAHNDNELVVKGMVDLAIDKGWKSIEVNGTPEFKQQVWLEGTARGRSVKGYEPSLDDMARLKERVEREQLPANTIASTQPAKVGSERSTSTSAPHTVPRFEAGTTLKRTELAGQVLELGRAPYKHQPDEPINYYIKLSDSHGNVTTVWGKDLERAATEIDLKVGDRVQSIARQGKSQVSVQAHVRDDQNNIVGTERKETHLNTWHIVKEAPQPSLTPMQATLIRAASQRAPGETKAQVEARATERLLEMAQAGVQPKVEVYDVKAPSTVVRESRNVPQPTRERTLNR